MTGKGVLLSPIWMFLDEPLSSVSICSVLYVRAVGWRFTTRDVPPRR